MTKLTKEEKDKLGKPCKCKRCGIEGNYMKDPYAYDMYDEEKLVCLCESCAQEYRDDI